MNLYIDERDRRFGVVRRPLDVPQNGKSASFRSCVRAGEAKLRVCVREIMLLYAGLQILEFFCFALLRSSAYRLLCFTLVLSIFFNSCGYMHGFDVVMLVCMVLAWVSLIFNKTHAYTTFILFVMCCVFVVSCLLIVVCCRCCCCSCYCGCC